MKTAQKGKLGRETGCVHHICCQSIARKYLNAGIDQVPAIDFLTKRNFSFQQETLLYT